MKKIIVIIISVICLVLIMTSCDKQNEFSQSDSASVATDDDVQNSNVKPTTDEAIVKTIESRFDSFLEYRSSEMSKDSNKGLRAYRLIEIKNYGIIIYRDLQRQESSGSNTLVEAFSLNEGELVYSLLIPGSYTNERILEFSDNVLQVCTDREITIIDLTAKEHQTYILNDRIMAELEKKNLMYADFNPGLGAYHAYDYDQNTNTIYFEKNKIIYATTPGSDSVSEVFDVTAGISFAEQKSNDYAKMLENFKKGEVSLDLFYPQIVDNHLVATVSISAESNGGPFSGYAIKNLSTGEEKWYFDMLFYGHTSEYSSTQNSFPYFDRSGVYALFYPENEEISYRSTSSPFISTPDLLMKLEFKEGELIQTSIYDSYPNVIAKFNEFSDRKSLVVVGENLVLIQFADNVSGSYLKSYLVPLSKDTVSDPTEVILNEDATNTVSSNRVKLTEEEQRTYNDKYLSPLLMTQVVKSEWHDVTELDVEEIINVYYYNYDMDHTINQFIPSIEVENYLSSIFDIDPMILRASHHYDHAKDEYFFEPIEGLGGSRVIPMEIERKNNILKLYCGINGQPDWGLLYLLTIRLDDGNGGFVYLSCEEI